MKKNQANNLLYLENKCPECKRGRMEVVEGIININNFFLRCKDCGWEYDD